MLLVHMNGFRVAVAVNDVLIDGFQAFEHAGEHAAALNRPGFRES